MKRWKSIAEWDSCYGFENNTTTDKHDTKKQAKAVCRMLERDGLGGERCHFPIKTRVAEIVKCSHCNGSGIDKSDFLVPMPICLYCKGTGTNERII